MSARITFTVEQDDKGWKALQARLRPLVKGPRAEVGVVGPKASEKHPGTKVTMAELAATHEYGSPKNRIPERSFIRSTIEASNYTDFLRPLLKQLLEWKITVKKILTEWGKLAANDIKERLLKGAPLSPPLSKRTIEERKKRAQERAKSGEKPGKLRDTGGRFLSLKNVGTRPLVDQGYLVAAIGYEVSMSEKERAQA